MNKKIFAAVAIAAAAGVAYSFIGTTPGGEAGFAQAEPPRGTQIVQVTLPATLSETARMGQRAFDAKCASCHGPNAAGQTGIAPPLIHKIYEPGHHADLSFVMAARRGVRSHHWPFGDMPPVEGVTDADVKMIVRYIREVQQANGIF
ncbi:cytochrome c [Thalassovita sp.]|uniref:c-type cytochrome n=1 Tax=Thalassovita sp. TaxID=1979401 RepID=UPI002B26CCCD|nr:cytochrome c [Thalassovita sp.]